MTYRAHRLTLWTFTARFDGRSGNLNAPRVGAFLAFHVLLSLAHGAIIVIVRLQVWFAKKTRLPATERAANTATSSALPETWVASCS
jgi:hypothetical protein